MAYETYRPGEELNSTEFSTETPVFYQVFDLAGRDFDIGLTFSGTVLWRICDEDLYRTASLGLTHPENGIPGDACEAVLIYAAESVEQRIPYTELKERSAGSGGRPGQILSEKYRDRYGIEIMDFRLDDPVIMEEDRRRIEVLQRAAELAADPKRTAELLKENTEKLKEQFLAQGGWYCPSCGCPNEGNFCTHCGTKRPEEDR